MPLEKSLILTDDRIQALLTLFNWVEAKGADGGTMGELESYEQSIHWTGDRLETYLVRCPTWFHYDPSRNAYVLSAEGKARYEQLKRQYR